MLKHANVLYELEFIYSVQQDSFLEKSRFTLCFLVWFQTRSTDYYSLLVKYFSQKSAR